MPKLVEAETEKLKKVLSFRLTEDDFLKYKAKFSASGLTQSEFFREHVLSNTTQVVAPRTASGDAKRAAFLLQKASNNLNQLAHRANSENAAGVLSEGTFLTITHELQRLNDYMLEQAQEANK